MAPESNEQGNRPDELASELGVTGKTVRRWLRENYTRPDADWHKPWSLTAAQANAVRRRFATPHRKAESREGMVEFVVALDARDHARLKRIAEQERAAMAQLVRDAVHLWLTVRRAGQGGTK